MGRNWSRGRRVGLALAVPVLLAAACTSSSDSRSSGSLPGTAPGGAGTGPGGAVTVTGSAPEVPSGQRYAATIRRTTDGVPHITGRDLPSAAFGQGWANAQDHGCSLADQLLKVQGRRAEALGAGTDDANVNSDFAWRAIGIDARARADWPSQSAPVREEIDAFAAGWNRYLADVGADGFTGWCKGEPWVQPITGEDVYAYARSITLSASSAQLVRYLGKAQPPTEAAAPASFDPGGRMQPVAAPATFEPPPPIASNGWAIGTERSSDGGGMLLANPHFPWEGELRFWEVHLIVPGQTDIYGAQLLGVPGVGIGFTKEYAWTHTVSAGNRFTAYTLDLVAGKPTSYKYDGGEKAMTSRDEQVVVRQDDGTTKTVTRTLWSSEYGPIIEFPGVGWSPAMTITYRDANIDNTAFADQYLAMDTAKDFDEFRRAHEEHQGVPLFNTIAVSRDGRAWYADTSATPNLSKAALDAYDASLKTNIIASTAANSGAVILDGSKSLNQWVDEPGARSPGLVPYSKMPQDERRDYVFNANDSFWLDHDGTVVEGDYSILHGRMRTARSVRTRENAVVLRDTTSSGASGADGRFDLEELRTAALANHGYSSRALREAVVARCQGTTTVEVPELKSSDGASVVLPAGSIDVSKACSVLAAWDGAYDLDRRGPMVWRELMARFPSGSTTAAGELWAEPFDAAKPVETPSGLAPAPAAPAPDPVLVYLARAVQTIEKAGLAVDATLGEVQFSDRNGTRVPIHGGNGLDGTTNVVGWGSSSTTGEPAFTREPPVSSGTSLTPQGYPVNNGTSFLLAVELGDGGPHAWARLTYGETGDRTSPLFVEQTQRFSAKEWRQVAYQDADIEATIVGSPTTVTG